MRKLLSLVLWIPLFCSGQEHPFINPGQLLSFGTASNRTASIASGDVDGDGDLDVITAEGRHWPTANFIFYNVGNGRFRTARTLDAEWSSCYAAEPGDLDGDGDLDIITGNDRHPNIWYRNDGQGLFERVGAV